MTSGIYEIVNKNNGNRYIGSTRNFSTRKINHFSRLNRGVHHSRHLQSAYELYGKDSFEYKIILICELSDLLYYEQLFIDKFNPEYNMSPATGGPGGCKWSEDQREARRGNGNPAFGRQLSEKHKRRISEFNKGKIVSDETKRKTKMALNGHVVSDESKRKNREAHLGKKASDETRAKMSNSRIGHVVSEETKKHLKAAWIKRKAKLGNAECA